MKIELAKGFNHLNESIFIISKNDFPLYSYPDTPEGEKKANQHFDNLKNQSKFEQKIVIKTWDSESDKS